MSLYPWKRIFIYQRLLAMKQRLVTYKEFLGLMPGSCLDSILDLVVPKYANVAKATSTKVLAVEFLQSIKSKFKWFIYNRRSATAGQGFGQTSP